MIVELGTGYFCEKTVPAAIDLIDRKVCFSTGIPASLNCPLMQTQLVIKSIESVENV